ncbi:FAD-dependent monooxygenase [Nocardia cyriacigeorgica]|uniref:FAD-dependent monooxygenase n=1 Tax=Nocardia cyriacigeorgica TaxID=135487 RepID=UPI0018959FE1|nr:FAD-dependent monooxygenase [Nocardia cyriacigeorgica]MBF6437352.1 FAD-dependent monooxygenase [Nocardia cyriacigeorgica]
MTTAPRPDHSSTDALIDTDVLVVGGGPVGMLVAAELALQQIRTVVVETRTELDVRPRAGTVHARSLSLLARRGYLPGVRPEDIRRDPHGVRRTRFQFAAQPVLALSAPSVEPAPIAGIPQARLEAAFEERARELGARILRGHTVTGLTETAEAVRADVLDLAGDRTLRIRAAYAVGADGARSLVARTGNFPATTYPASMNAIAGLAVAAAPEQIPPGWNPTSTGWTMHNPNPYGQARIIAMDFSGPLEHRPEPTVEEYRDRLGHVLGTPPELAEISHLTRFSDHGRFRTRLRDGRLLLAGDAAHSHYPLGGQGLNTGMQDAFALGWRLARVITGGDPPTILDDYSRERVAVASAVVGNTVLQSRMMNPHSPQLRDAVLAMLAVPVIHDAVAQLISGQFQSGFQHDLVLTEADGRERTLVELLRAGRFVAIRPDEHTPVPDAPADALVVTGKVTPDQTWTSALIRPDGYLAATL